MRKFGCARGGNEDGSDSAAFRRDLRPENYDLLHQNGTIFWLQRDWRKLPTDGRPISQTRDLSELLHERTPAYTRFADHIIDNNGTVEETLRQILEVLP